MQPASRDVRARTVGVEEEFLLVRAGGHRLAPVVEAVTEATVTPRGAAVAHEFKQEQVELGTAVCSSMAEVAAGLQDLRRRLCAAAAGQGALLVASGTSPIHGRPHAGPGARYERMHRAFGLVAWQNLTCGMHVHVAVDSREEGVAVLDRISSWLSTLRALSVNSPFWQGEDTGYTSYRTILWGQWPTAGPVTAFGDVAGYDRARRELITSGAALDDAMIYFDARLSESFPTVEVRVADVCLRTPDSVLIAALARVLVEAAAVRWRNGEPYPPMRAELLQAAMWRAARYGMSAQLVDPVTSTVRPAWELVAALIDWVSVAPSFAADADLIAAGLARIRREGTGCDVQRALRDQGDLTFLVKSLAEQTIA